MTRREKIARLTRLGFIASQASAQLAAAEPAPLTLDLARKVQDLAAAAQAVAELVERELLALESAREWEAGA